MMRRDITPEQARKLLRQIVITWIAISAFGVLILHTWWFSVVFGVLSLAGVGLATYGRHKSLKAQREEWS